MQECFRSRRTHSVLSLLMLPLLALLAGGCGGAKEKPAAATSEGTPPAAAAAPAPASEVQTAARTSAPEKSEKTKWINDIPYDVFYDRPLEVAADGAVVATATPGPSPVTPQAQPEMSTAESPADSSPGQASEGDGVKIDWATIAPVETLAEEVTVLRNRLTANLNTVATYNRNIDQITIDATVLGAIASVLTVHPEQSRWDDNAKFIRDLAYEMWMSADGTGSKPFRATQEPFEYILEILSGGPAPPGREADDVVPFADIVDRSDMMRRIDMSFNSLKSNINTDDRLRESAADTIRELTVLAMFGAMMQTDGYDSADEPNYQSYAQNFIDGSTAARQAAEMQDFEAYSAAINKIQTSCGECHAEYRGASDGF